MDTLHHETLDTQKEQDWFDQSHQIQEIRKKGLEAVMRGATQEQILHAFEGREKKVCCMDEGISEGVIRTAGSGILLEGTDRLAFIEAMKKNNIQGIQSHEECGAAALFKKQKGIEGKTTDEIAIEHAKQLAHEIGVPYLGHISASEMKRPKEYHHARVLYYDGTGRFQPHALNGVWPNGFVVSRRFLTEEASLREVALALDIAFGDHGFGKKFSTRESFLIIAIGDTKKDGFSATQMEEELMKLQQQLFRSRDIRSGRIEIRDFSAPEMEQEKNMDELGQVESAVF
ncbi:MAG: hypothetical protein UU48_C0001G0060 [Candidatus Uhrbacteria bacterium GW2011_GWF2_41_16]|uniref:Uncharacterized protein n=2 Tax=Candidatus Uhriibacteriota TaxID=1752732 RepID=A0A0G0XPI3_9BACT|nr:MAG: hypothetical protein UU31_C0002G0129 [Candidatus Uhrbacteria bacterium GW2011_GWA2_41_10]KKR87766.1 MAG: hypothetical protein UU35_C0001G0047 [Candidatus Uhrbacteria bacterium GW2011_GWC2_41_11]KKR98705.1 MAG: hypothetical protein UU48_C0001G0060 [Candidatus Uhrbacteria bacterium GW2011_GWF2_41_16]HBP00199.1 hypothetical protein [Candidatus Uhrbacteria bacterium]